MQFGLLSAALTVGSTSWVLREEEGAAGRMVDSALRLQGGTGSRGTPREFCCRTPAESPPIQGSRTLGQTCSLRRQPRDDAGGTKGLSPALWQHSSCYQRVLGDAWLRRKARGEALKQAQVFYFVSLPRMMHGLAGRQLGKDKMKPTCEGAFLNAFISPLSAGAFFQEIRPSGHAQGNCVWNSF